MLANITEAMRRGDFAAALQTARDLVAEEPDNFAAQHLLGICLRQMGDLAGARVALERAIALSPEQSSLYFSLASLDLAEGKAEAADAGLKQSLRLDPNQLGAYVTLVHLALARRDQDEAERNLRLAQRVNANHPQVVIAEGFLAQARGNPDLALRCFTAAAESDPNLHEAQLALGKAYLSRGMWPFAEQALANALRLDPTRSSATLRDLVQARRRQGNAEGALEALDELVQRHPADLALRGARGELRVAAGRVPQALEEFLAILDRQPDHLVTLGLAVQLLIGSDRLDEARARIEAALAKSPQVDELWMMRLNVSGRLQEDAKDLLDRWHAASPSSATCMEMIANYHQTRGELAQAEAWADRALAIKPLLFISGLIKVQALLADQPEEALAHADRMLAGAAADRSDIQRTLHGWAGIALDAMGRYDEAAERWRRLIALPDNQLMPPPQVPAESVAEGSIEGTLLWAPVGVRAEAALGSMLAAMGSRLRVDRLSAVQPGDGFGLVRWPPGAPGAGTAASWTQGMLAAGAEPSQVVDLLPHVDAYTLASLQGARVLALLADPRDALLNWMVNGSVQKYAVAREVMMAADWLAASLEALADHRDAHPGKVVLARLDGDVAEAGQAIETLLGLSEPLAALQGSAPQFPAGHWRKYAGPFGEAFARLTPVAVRLGYPLS
ncbi:MAG: tetratricopeptide repeat protein [Arenimonas sp.]|nr:tetratricopeptide repeat protein [Arenimonas sp.]